MSSLRQFLPDPDGYPVRGLAVTYPDGHWLPTHTHPWAQLVYAASGVMQVSTPQATWLVPPTRAIWVPGKTPHGIRMRGAVAMRTLYLSPIDPDAKLAVCRALEVRPLLRELILHIVRLGMLTLQSSAEQTLANLLVDLLAAEQTAPYDLPLPRDARARGFAERLVGEAGESATLAERARRSGASLRTLQRLFLKETGLSLDAWRTRLRLQQGMVALSGGAAVTEAALEAGYQSPSAFIAAFKRAYGLTPARYRARAA